MSEVFAGLESGTLLVLAAGLFIAFAFEFVNGFHDTANAVATVIYTRTMRPVPAVVWSGVWNAMGVLHAMTTGLVVAFSIVHLLPVELLVSAGSKAGVAMVFSLLAAAVAWNLGTWYLGLPASSSHTLIGSVLGVGLAATVGTQSSLGSGVNWAVAGQVLLSLVVSPFVGFVVGGLCLLAAQRLFKNRRLHEPADADERPPLAVRVLLMLGCTGVSFAHGSNDGQKGVGLVMLILIGLVPAGFALDLSAGREPVVAAVAAIDDLEVLIAQQASAGRGFASAAIHDDGRVVLRPAALATDPISDFAAFRSAIEQIRGVIAGRPGVADIPEEARWPLRVAVLRVRQAIVDYEARHATELPVDVRTRLRHNERNLVRLTEYAPSWVPICVAIALGFGTMIGWKRIAVTVGEKIGATPMSYAQGTVAQLVTGSTILAASVFGAPVSTTHVLSSSVAGSMAASGAGLQGSTLKHIALAWLLTLPASMALGALFFLTARALF